MAKLIKDAIGQALFIVDMHTADSGRLTADGHSMYCLYPSDYLNN